jgi:hypothetical protein
MRGCEPLRANNERLTRDKSTGTVVQKVNIPKSKMMTVEFCSLLSLLLLLLPSADASTQFSIAPNGVSCNGDFEVTSLNVECDNYCTWGSDVILSGTGENHRNVAVSTKVFFRC